MRKLLAIILEETKITKREDIERNMEKIEEAKELWSDMLPTFRKSFAQITFDMWITKITPLKIENNTLVLCTEKATASDFIKYNFLDTITKLINEHAAQPLNVEILAMSAPEVKEETAPQREDLLVIEEVRNDNHKFNKDYTFDNFVVGQSNEVVFNAAKSVVEDPGRNINPLFIYGGVGLGKTHIIHAIANSIVEKNSNIKIQYSTTDRFISDFIDSINKTKDNELIKEFRKKYRNVDILMLDDVQFLNGKSATQEMLFHLFNDLMLDHKQIIFTSDRHPKELSQLEERMRSRFLSGLTLDIGYPDLETRIAILQRKVYQKKYCVKRDILEYIAEKIDTNIRELEGALHKVAYTCSLAKTEPTIESVNQILRDDFDSKSGPLSMDLIVSKTGDFFSVSREDILSKKRSKNIVEARQMAIYLILELISVPLASVGEYLGGRDHTTVIHSRNKIQSLIRDNTMFKNYAEDIIESIRKS